ncbi:MAG: HD-GYP domain-containing protein [Nitrospirae bacterium]|nr:HD-GYP domain-containing protein [Nitrospirota bacterium]
MSVARKIHITLIKRLILGWFVLSILLGVAVFFIKLQDIDEMVKDLAISESKMILNDKRFFTQGLSEQENNLMTDKLKLVIKYGNFISVELYTTELKKLYEVTSNDIDAMEAHNKYIEPKETVGKEKGSMFTNNITSERFYINGRIFLQFVVPLFDKTNKKYGYMEGIYRTNNHTMKDIRHSLVVSLLVIVLAVSVTAIIFYPLVISMNNDLIKHTRNLTEANLGMLETLGSTIAKRDSDTNSHNYRVAIYAVSLGEALHLKDDEIRSLIKGSFLHDIGKIAISDNILLKPGKLTEEEFEHMKDHVLHGMDIVGRYSWLRDAVDVVVYHHERYDGKGYSGQLMSEEIPIGARIFAIVDVFDALTSKRPYKEPYSYEETLEIIKENSGKHFDPKLLEVFIDMSFDLYDKISKSEDNTIEKMMKKLVRKYFVY